MRIILASQGRTGSSMLFQELKKLPGSLWLGELNNPRVNASWIADASPERQLELLEQRGWRGQEGKMVGFKLRTDMAGFEAAALDPAVKVIHLTRNCWLRRLVSEWVGRAKENWSVTAPADDSVRLSFTMRPDYVRRMIREYAEIDRQAEAVFSRHASVRVAYEDLVGDQAECHWHRILDFLEVEHTP